MAGNIPLHNLQVEVTNRQILKIALPISFSLLVPQINFITNNIFLSQLGEQELGLAGLTGVYYLIFAAIGSGLNNGLQALIARRAGEDRVSEIAKLFWQGVRISAVIAALAIGLTYFVAPVVMKLSLSNEVNEQKAVAFLKIRIWGLPFLYLYQMRNALLVGTNLSKYLIWGTAAETITNIVLDYGLIFGHLGLPALGFNGAAIASICAEFVGMLVVYAVIKYKGIARRLQLFWHTRYDAVNAKLILVQSSPLIFQFAISIMSWEFFYILIEHKGDRDLAISNAMRNIFGFFGVWIWAFASTTNAMVSNVIGQGLKDQVIPLIQKIVRLSFSVAIGIVLIINIFPETFLSIYGRGGDFISEAIPVVRVVSAAMLLMSFSTIWLNAVTGTGNTKINLLIEVAAIIGYSIYVYLVFEVYDLSITYGWMS